MKIFNRKDFLQLPANTAYVKYSEKCGLSELIEIKVSGPHDGWGNDWITNDLAVFVEEPYRDVFTDFSEVTDTFRFAIDQTSRDGLFEENEMYAVFDNEDIERVINKLKSCLK